MKITQPRQLVIICLEQYDMTSEPGRRPGIDHLQIGFFIIKVNPDAKISCLIRECELLAQLLSLYLSPSYLCAGGREPHVPAALDGGGGGAVRLLEAAQRYQTPGARARRVPRDPEHFCAGSHGQFQAARRLSAVVRPILVCLHTTELSRSLRVYSTYIH